MVGTCDVNSRLQQASSMKYVDCTMKISAPNCQTVPIHAKDSKAWYANETSKVQKPSTNGRGRFWFQSTTEQGNRQILPNKNDNVQNKSAKANNELWFSSLPEEMKPKLMSRKKAKPRRLTLIKNRNKLMGQDTSVKLEDHQELTIVIECSRH